MKLQLVGYKHVVFIYAKTPPKECRANRCGYTKIFKVTKKKTANRQVLIVVQMGALNDVLFI